VKLVGLIKMYSKETYSEVRIRNKCRIQFLVKEGGASSLLLVNFSLVHMYSTLSLTMCHFHRRKIWCATESSVL